MVPAEGIAVEGVDIGIRIGPGMRQGQADAGAEVVGGGQLVVRVAEAGIGLASDRIVAAPALAVQPEPKCLR